MKKVAMLIPQTNLMVERDIVRFLSENRELNDNLSFHFSRINIDTRYKENKYKYLEEVYNNYYEAKKLFGTLNMDVFCFMCTSAIIHNKKINNFVGYGNNDFFLDPLLGLYNAIKDKKINSLLIISPYDIEYSTLLEQDIKNNSGVKGIKTVALNIDYKLPEFNNQKIYEIFCKNNGYDMVFIPCTNFDSIESIKCIERNSNTFVINSNTATIYAILKSLKITNKIDSRFGKIFS